MLSELGFQFDTAQKNIGQAALLCPIYGILFCTRSVMSRFQNSKKFIQKLYEKCLEISALIEPILSSESPEGYLIEFENFKVTAQILLLFSWRTSKEISLIFGQICPFLEESQVLDLCNYFTHQLSVIKHRGAFEQAFVGFCSLCSFLWKQDQFAHIPVRILEETLTELSGNEKKFCATRRSAGIPFLIQAVVTTETEMKSSR